MVKLTAEELACFTEMLFSAAGASPQEAQIVAKHLVDANLCGHDSHGVLRVPQYLGDIEQQRIRPGSDLITLTDWPTGALLDATGMFGQVAGHLAAERAIRMAGQAGIAAVTLKSMNHSGRLGSYVSQVAAAGLLGFCAANAGGAGQWVAPFGGKERRLSTNPLAFAAPSGKEFPVLVDISTCVAPEGKIRDFHLRRQEVPEGWLIDANGETTRNPGALYDLPGGALLPLGGNAGHKGFGLAVMVDVLAGALSGAGCSSPEAEATASGSGMFLLAIHTDRFRPAAEFRQEIDRMLDYLTSSQAVEGHAEVMAPGEYEFRRRRERLAEGIPLPDAVWESLVAAAASRRVGVPDVSDARTAATG